MPWLLDTPITTGSADPDGDITHLRAKLIRNDPDMQMTLFAITYGRAPEGKFVEAVVQPNAVNSYIVEGEDWVSWRSTHVSNDGELSYDAAKRAVYEELLAQEVIPPGQIV